MLTNSPNRQSNLIINHNFEPLDYYDAPDRPVYRYDNENFTDSNNMTSTNFSYDHALNNFPSSSTHSNSTFNSGYSTNNVQVFTNLTTSSHSSLAQTISLISTSNFIQDNSFNNNFHTMIPTQSLEEDQELDENDEESASQSQ